MDTLDRKIIDDFPGKVVRKDLTSLMKKGANVPTYVQEYLLGMYCTTDDEEAIALGIEKIKRILSENYVRPDQSEYVKSKIKENGQYTTGAETIVEVPEIANGTLIPAVFEPAGYVYAVGRSVDNKVGVYRLENKLVDGSGKLSFRNVEGLSGAPKAVRDSITAAFNYFGEHSRRLVSGSYETFDYSLYFNDLQNRGVSEEVSVAEVVGLFSAIAARPVMPSTIICGRVVMSGGMMPLTTGLDEVFVTASNAGARKILLPEDSSESYDMLSGDLKSEIHAYFYSTPLEAAKLALGVDT